MCDSSSILPACIPHSPPHRPTTATCCYCTIQAHFWLIDHHIVSVFPSFRVWVWIPLLTLSVSPFLSATQHHPVLTTFSPFQSRNTHFPPKLTKYTLTASQEKRPKMKWFWLYLQDRCRWCYQSFSPGRRYHRAGRDTSWVLATPSQQLKASKNRDNNHSLRYLRCGKGVKTKQTTTKAGHQQRQRLHNH